MEAGTEHLEDVIARIQRKVWKQKLKIVLSARCPYIFIGAKKNVG